MAFGLRFLVFSFPFGLSLPFGQTKGLLRAPKEIED
jgi:hypothetical protein